MSNPIDDAYDAWKEADGEARELEHEVGEAWRLYDSGKGSGPAREKLRELAWRRHVAAERLAHAIGLLHDAGLIQPPARSQRLAYVS